MNIKEITKKTSLDNNIKEKSKFIDVLKGSITAIVITLISLVIFSTVLANTNINENTIIPVIIAVTAISILIGSIISVSKISKKGLLNGALVGLIYIAIIYLLSSMVNGNFSFDSNSLIIIISAKIAGLFGGIIRVTLIRLFRETNRY